MKDRLSRETLEELVFIFREWLLTSEVQRQESESRGDRVTPLFKVFLPCRRGLLGGEEKSGYFLCYFSK